MKKKNYFPYLSTFKITSNDILSFNLKKYTKIVSLEYNLKPDLLFINGEQINPQAKLTLPIGQTTIFAYKKDHPFFQKTVEIDFKTDHFKINFKEIKPGAVVQIDTIPQGARVFLNGLELGKTPTEFKNLLSSQYQWRLKKTGYKDEFIDIGLKKKEKRAFKIKLIQNKFELGILVPQKGRIILYNTNHQVLLSTDVDTSGIDIKLPPSKYLIEYFQEKNTISKEINLLSNYSVVFSRQKKWSFSQVPIKKMAFDELLFIVRNEKEIYFVDAKKGVFNTLGKIFLPRVFMSDWKNCFIVGNTLYIGDSLNIHQGNLTKKSSWKNIYRSSSGFIKSIYPIEEGVLVLHRSGNWASISKEGKISDVDLFDEVDSKEFYLNKFDYKNSQLYLLYEKKMKVIRISMNSAKPIVQIIHLNTGKNSKVQELSPLIHNYTHLQVQEKYLYLWSQKNQEMHIYNSKGEMLEVFQSPINDFIDSFVINKNKIWFKTGNKVFCFGLIRTF